MPFQVVPDTASFRIVGHTGSGAIEIVNTVYVRDTVQPWTSGYLTQIAEVIGNQWRDETVPLLASTYIFDRVDAVDEGAEFGNQITAEYNATGGNVAAALSAALCMQVKIGGDGGSAPRRGRLFISPFTEDKIAVDTWDATLASDVQVTIQDLPTLINASSATAAMVLVSRYSKAENPVFPHKRDEAVTNTIGSFEVPQKLAMQRDRRTGEGS